MKKYSTNQYLVRLKHRKEFLELTTSGKKGVMPGLILQAKKRFDNKIGIGFTVSRKVGNAVVRNRVRRRLKVLVRKVLSDEKLAGYNLVIIGRVMTNKRSFDQLTEDFIEALEKVGAIGKSRMCSHLQRPSG